MVTDTIAKFGGIDIIVSNAVCFSFLPLTTPSPSWDFSLTHYRDGQGSAVSQI